MKQHQWQALQCQQFEIVLLPSIFAFLPSCFHFSFSFFLFNAHFSSMKHELKESRTDSMFYRRLCCITTIAFLHYKSYKHLQQRVILEVVMKDAFYCYKTVEAWWAYYSDLRFFASLIQSTLTRQIKRKDKQTTKSHN